MAVPLKRVDGWEGRFAQFIERAKHHPFAWGYFDCVLFAAESIDVLTLSTFYIRFVSKYKNIFGAHAMLKSLGYDNLMQAVAMETGGLVISPKMGTVGDVIVLPISPEYPVGACGVIIDENVAFLGKDGLVYQKITDLLPGSICIRIG